MDSPKGAVWLGHCRLGGRFYLKTDEIYPGINILGGAADAIAAVLARACIESGLSVLVLDFNGRLSEKLGGCLEERSMGGFLYDSMRLDEKSSLHAELAASAYTISLNLSFEQEAFLNSAMQVIGLEQGVASPASLADRLNASGEYRGHTADELKGKFGALRSLNVTGEAGVVGQMLGRSCVASFAQAESHQAAEVAMMLFIAKVLTLGEAGVEPLPDALIVNEASRVFVNLPASRHGNRLLIALLSSKIARILAAEHTYGLDQRFLDTSPTRITSSGLWNEAASVKSALRGQRPSERWTNTSGPKGPGAESTMTILTPNMFVLQDFARGYEEVFVPRTFASLEAQPRIGAQPEKDDGSLAKQILAIASTYDDATRGSIVSYLSSENPRDEIERSLDKLQSEGFLTTVAKDTNKDSMLQTVRLTQSGYDLLRRLG